MEFIAQFEESNQTLDAQFEESSQGFSPDFGNTIKGDAGFSPICEVKRNEANTGVTISIQDEDSTETADVYDGSGAEALSIEEINEILGW